MNVGAVVVVLLTLIVSFVCVKKAKLEARKPPVLDYTTLARGSQPSDAYVEPLRRYVDSDSSGKPVMQGNMLIRPPPHAHELHSFTYPGKKQPRPLPQQPRGSTYVSEVYDCPQ